MAEYIVNIDGWLRTFTGESIVRRRDCKNYDDGCNEFKPCGFYNMGCV